MSTRANILIQYGETSIYIYRHCDGYPAGLGVDLAEKVTKAKNAADLVRLLLAEKYAKQSYEKKARHVYELTTEFHGDIEWAYVVHYPTHRFAKQEPTVIGVSDLEFGARLSPEERERHLAALPVTRADFSAEDFAAYAKREEAKMIEREKAYAAKRA